jgi:hypothetical protein
MKSNTESVRDPVKIKHMYRFSLANLLLAIVPLGVAFWSAGQLFRSRDLAISILLLACLCTTLAATVGALSKGKQGLQRGLVMGATAIMAVGFGAALCVIAVLFLLTIAGLFS